MKIYVQYTAQLKMAAGVEGEQIEIDDSASAGDVVRQIARRSDGRLQPLLLTEDGSVQPTILLFVGENCVSRGVPQELQPGDTLTIMLPISGG